MDTVIQEFQHWQHERVDTFIAYLNKHRHRIVNYSYFQAEGISIGSGTIESTVKQIGARIKLSGAQWKAENVPQVLLHRCAYLNGQFSIWDLQNWDAPEAQATFKKAPAQFVDGLGKWLAILTIERRVVQSREFTIN